MRGIRDASPQEQTDVLRARTAHRCRGDNEDRLCRVRYQITRRQEREFRRLGEAVGTGETMLLFVFVTVVVCPHPDACIRRAIHHLGAVLNATAFITRQHHMDKAFARLQDASSLLY